MKELDELIKAVELAVVDIKKYDSCGCGYNDGESRSAHAESTLTYVAMCLIPALEDYKNALKS
jgi:hypothetical protein